MRKKRKCLKNPKVKGKNEFKFHQDFSSFYDEMNDIRQRGDFLFEADLFIKNTEGMDFILHDALLDMKILHTKSQIENKNNKLL